VTVFDQILTMLPCSELDEDRSIGVSVYDRRNGHHVVQSGQRRELRVSASMGARSSVRLLHPERDTHR
jgi:hypothetical protein